MPAKDGEFWRQRLGSASPSPCHYQDPFTDWYADRVRRAGIKRVWPADPVESVLDIGCGDGKMSAWLARQFGVTVTGTDEYYFPKVEAQVGRWVQVDAEALATRFDIVFDLAACITSLCCVEDWRAALGQIVQVADLVLVVENTMTPTPPWKKGLPQLHHIEYNDLTVAMGELGYRVSDQTVINVLDRALMIRCPAWLLWAGMLATLAVDLAVSPLVPLPSNPTHGVYYGRYSAILFEEASSYFSTAYRSVQK